MTQQLYSKRFNEHISHAKILFKNGDYVQAGEKIWGALSAIINSKSRIEARSPDQKRRNFLGLFSKYQQTHPNVRSQMRQLGFRNDEEIFHVAFGLHKFFYGGASYTNQELLIKIPFLIQIIENL